MHNYNMAVVIDFVRCILPKTCISHLFNNSEISFQETYDMNTGELKEQKSDSIRGMKITIHPSGRVIIDGSLHKFHNAGFHNHNDFTWTSLKLSIQEIERITSVQASEIQVIRLEYGLNLTTRLNANDVVNGVVFLKRNPFEKTATSGRNGNYCQADFSDYRFKVYNKTAQYKLSEQKVRLEVHAKKMRHINQCLKTTGQIYLSDILHKESFEYFCKDLIDKWSECVFVDPLQDIPFEQKNQMQLYSSWVYWKDLIDTRCRGTIRNHKEKLKQLNQKYCSNIQEELLRQIINKRQLILN